MIVRTTTYYRFTKEDKMVEKLHSIGLTYSMLAEKLGKTRQWVCDLFNGRISANEEIYEKLKEMGLC